MTGFASRSLPGRRGQAGFTFIEVLVALAVCVLLVSAVCSSLLTSLRAEQTADGARAASFEISQLTSQSWLGTLDSKAFAAHTEWDLAETKARAPGDDGQAEWRVLNLGAKDRPSMHITIALQQGPAR